MPALERMLGTRVVGDPEALDSARWSPEPTHTAETVDDVIVLRFSPDEAFAIGARDVEIDDEHALVVDEAGFVGAWCQVSELWPHIEWEPDLEGPTLAQGSIAGVPAKLWSPDDGEIVLLLTAAAHAYELESRLGWRS